MPACKALSKVKDAAFRTSPARSAPVNPAVMSLLWQHPLSQPHHGQEGYAEKNLKGVHERAQMLQALNRIPCCNINLCPVVTPTRTTYKQDKACQNCTISEFYGGKKGQEETNTAHDYITRWFHLYAPMHHSQASLTDEAFPYVCEGFLLCLLHLEAAPRRGSAIKQKNAKDKSEQYSICGE